MFSIRLKWIKKNFIMLILFIAFSSITQDKALASMDKPKQNCSLSINSTQLSTDHVILNFSLENPYNKKMRLLIWHTPFEGFLSDLFIITNKDTGKKLNYQGPMVKRLQPQPEDYLSLTQNQRSSTTLNLSFSYHFKQGHYQVQLKKNTFHFEDEHLTPFLFTCETSTVNFSIK